MIVHQGVYLPDGERHLVDWMTRSGEIVDGKGSYQIKKLRAALSYCTQFRTAVDVGSHVGLWSLQLAKRFEFVEAFEPVSAHRECFARNIPSLNYDPHPEGWSDTAIIKHVTLHAFALGEHDGSIRIETAATSSGDSRVGGDGDIPMRRLDDFHLTDVDFIKLDCEGYELFALRGGEETIKRDMPVIIAEQKPGRAQRFGLPETGAVTYLQGLGYRLAETLSGDYIMVPA